MTAPRPRAATKPTAHMQCAKCGHEYTMKAAAVDADGAAYFGSAYDFCPKCDGSPKEMRRTPVRKLPPKTIIHINQHVLRANAKAGTNDPVITVKRGRTNTYAHEVDILGPSKVVYSPGKPLSCGARCWVETHAEVVTR